MSSAYPIHKRVRDLIYDTPIEIAIGALIIGSAGGWWVYQHNNEKMGQTPIAFSEIEGTLKEAQANGTQVGGLTTTLSYTNDVTMKVIESRNIAWVKAGGDDHRAFAAELETRINPALKKHALISEYAAVLPGEASRALESLRPISEAANDASAVSSAFSRVWSEDHDDHYRTKRYTVRECSGTGENRSCRNVTKTKRVYDYTIHTYTYHAEQGALASRALNSYLAGNPDITVRERLIPAKETHQENEEAMAFGLREKFEDKIPTKADILDYANTWVKGSNFTIYLPQVYSGHQSLVGLSPSWNAAAATAKSARYRTERRTDSGPSEYQVAKRTVAAAQQVTANSRKITTGIRAAATLVPQLNTQIADYVDAVKTGKKDLDGRRDRLMETTMSAYKQNFENGFDLNPFKWGMVILVTLLSTLAGCGLGTAADSYINSRKRRGFFMDDKEQNPAFDKKKKTLRELFGRKKTAATETDNKPKFDAPQL